MFEHAPKHWRRLTLGEIVAEGGGHIQTGPFGSQLHASDYVSVGIPSIMPVNIGDNRVVSEGIARISPDDARRLSKHIVREGDIIYSRRGDVERRALIRSDEDGWFCGTGCLKIRLGQGVILPEFASYYLAHPEVRAWIVRHAVGATMPNLNTSIVSAIPFLLPPMDEQQNIAEALGSLDDKIELNRRMNRTLEQMAQAIFKAWFVDFEPIRAKAAGAPSFPGMPQDAFQSLPASFADSEVGLVPRGWHARRLAEIAELTMGQSPSSDFYNKNGDGLPFHQGVSFFGTRFPVHDVFCTVRNRLAAKGDILFSVRAPVGRINIADRPLVLGRGLAGLRHRQGFQSFLLYSLKHQFAREDSIGDGTIFKAVTKGDMESIRVIDPPDSVVQAFERSVSSLDALIASNECEASVLADARDSTLRALF